MPRLSIGERTVYGHIYLSGYVQFNTVH